MKYSLTILFITLTFNSYAQYIGGNSDGYTSILWENPTSVYNGGNESGYDSYKTSNFESTYAGGLGSGYESALGLEQTASYSGGLNSGYINSVLYNQIGTYSGGIDDGYQSSNNIRVFIWTGSAGNDWNEADNWSTLDVPRIRHQVFIPDGVANYPILNTGLFTIKQNKNEGVYFCRSLNIQSNAEMTMAVNNYMENYGLIEVYGEIQVQSEINPAILNGDGGSIIIYNGGIISWE